MAKKDQDDDDVDPTDANAMKYQNAADPRHWMEQWGLSTAILLAMYVIILTVIAVILFIKS